MIDPDVQQVENPEELTASAAAVIAKLIRLFVEEKQICHLALSGGKTPEPLFQLLASPAYRTVIPWDHVHLYWADERFVPANDPRSNYGRCRELLLSHIDIPAAQVHPIRTDYPTGQAAALAYEQELKQQFAGTPQLDLVLLGIGADGHTASLFPASPALEETEHWTAATVAPDHTERITLTLPVFEHAHSVLFLATGQDKQKALRRVLHPHTGETPLPAARISPRERLIWFMDRDACPR